MSLFRKLATYSMTVAAVALVGCSSEKEPETDNTFIPPTSDDVETADTSVEASAKVLSEARFYAFVAFDPEMGKTGEVVNPNEGGDELVSVFGIELSTENNDGVPGEFCTIRFLMEGFAPEYGDASAGTGKKGKDAEAEPFVGFQIPQGDFEATEDCTDQGFEFATPTPEEWVELDFWIGMSGDLDDDGFLLDIDDDMEDWLTPDDTSDFDIEEFYGGKWISEDFVPSDDDMHSYWYGYSLSEAWTIDFDEPILRGDVVDNSTDTLGRGYYIFRMNLFWFWE